MAQTKRNGTRKTRDQFARTRIPTLGYYFIVTDTKETEQNYLQGLKESIPQELQGKLVIKVVKTRTKKLVEEAKNLASLHPQYGQLWIVFDRDQVEDFDEIIQKAKANGIQVGWSNPCIEVWFHAYFGTMPTYQTSVECCAGFSRTYQMAIKQKYAKADPELYKKLTRFGDETNAIQLARQKYEEHRRNGKSKPSAMCPCTMVHLLVEEIKSKIKGGEK